MGHDNGEVFKSNFIFLICIWFCIKLQFIFILFVYKPKNKQSIEGIDPDFSISRFGSIASMGDKRKIWNVMIEHCILFGIA